MRDALDGGEFVRMKPPTSVNPSRPNPKPPSIWTRIGIGLVILLCFAFLTGGVFLLFVLGSMGSGPHDAIYWGVRVIVSAVLTGGLVLIFGAYLSSKSPGPVLSCCECCGMARSTMQIGMNQVVGKIVIMSLKSMNGLYCKKCIDQVFRKFTLTTLLAGWWHPFGVLFTPMVLIYNTGGYLRSRFVLQEEGPERELPTPPGHARRSESRRDKRAPVPPPLPSQRTSDLR